MASIHRLFLQLILISLLLAGNGNHHLVRCTTRFHGHRITTVPGFHGVLPSKHYAGARPGQYVSIYCSARPGYLVGNGFVDAEFDGYNSHVPYAHGMGLISPDIFEDIQRACKGNYTQPSPSLKCRHSIRKGFESVGDINCYNILEPCYKYPSNNSGSSSASSLHRSCSMKSLNHQGRVITSSYTTSASHVPCFNDDLATTWLNNENVRKAIHAAPANIAGAWEVYSQRVDYTIDIQSVIPYYINLTTQGYRALIYSGDHDFDVPFTGTYAWIRSLGYNIIEPWRFWLSNTNQVAGYLQRYEKNITFLTIKGAGHMVPYYKPMEALTFYSRWLRGEPI